MNAASVSATVLGVLVLGGALSAVACSSAPTENAAQGKSDLAVCNEYGGTCLGNGYQGMWGSCASFAFNTAHDIENTLQQIGCSAPEWNQTIKPCYNCGQQVWYATTCPSSNWGYSSHCGWVTAQGLSNCYYNATYGTDAVWIESTTYCIGSAPPGSVIVLYDPTCSGPTCIKPDY